MLYYMCINMGWKMGRRKKKNNLLKILVSIILVGMLSVVSYYYEDIEKVALEYYNEISISTNNEVEEQDIETQVIDAKLQMHTIDVGQGDSILIFQEDKVMLIDAGTRANGEKVVKYLKDLGITKIDVLIGTHSHDDHMGGMAEVIKNFEIGELYAPDNSNDDITTVWYQEFLDAIIEKDIKWNFPKVEDEIILGDARAKILSPEKDYYENANNYSIVLRVSYKTIDILLTGDAEEEIENVLVDSKFELASEVYKVGHHGSDTSSSEEFMKKVNPKYSIISCKEGNTYKHPSKKVMQLLENLEINVYRTDKQGTIIMKTDGTNIEFNVEPGTYEPGK